MSQIQPKEKWKFLQKYWHKGAFFQETSDNPYAKDNVDDVYTRDYSAPTGEDKLDKSVLPKVMQVRSACCVLCACKGAWPKQDPAQAVTVTGHIT